MTPRWPWCGLVIAILPCLPVWAQAPQPLATATPVQSRIAAGDAACFQFDLPKGTSLSISAAARGFAPSLQLMRGAACDDALPQREARASSDGTARLGFVTGGGRYLVRVASVAADGTGSFVLTLAKAAGETAAVAATDTATSTESAPSPSAAEDPRAERMRQQVASHRQQVAAEQARQQAERQQREAEAAVRRQQEAIQRAEAEASRQQAFNAFIGGLNSVASDVASNQAQQQQMLDNLRQQLVQKQQAQQRAEMERERQAQRARELAQQERLRQAQLSADARARQTTQAPAVDTASPPPAGAAAQESDTRDAEAQRRDAAEEAERREEAAQAAVRAKAEQQRAAAEQQRQAQEAERRRQLAWQQSLAQFKVQLHLHASQCPGGDGDYFVVGAKPSFANCVTVHYEARCIGTPRGQGVRGSQGNFVGGSCQGMGDAIRIPGHLDCAADQVIVEATEATGC